MYWTNQNRIILQIYSIWYLRCQHVSSLTTNLSIISDLTNQIMIPYSGNMNQRHSKKVHRLCHPVLFPSLQSFSLFASVFRVIFSTTEPVHRLTWTQQETWIILSKRTPYHSSATVYLYAEARNKKGEEYEPDSVKFKEATLDHCLKHANYSHLIIIRDREFSESKKELTTFALAF